MSNNILYYWEHCGARKTEFLTKEDAASLSGLDYTKSFPKKHSGKDNSKPCFTIKKNKEGYYFVETGYFIGLDWVVQDKMAIYVAPKINTKLDETKEIDYEKILETDYLGMLFSALKQAETTQEIDELFLIKWEEPKIEIEQKQDLLTPLLVVEFLGVLKHIVKKGLKKSYYKVKRNLNSKVKGKVLVGTTIKQNLMKNKPLQTFCSYDEFGWNNKENRLLKKALEFVQRYLPNSPRLLKKEEKNPLQDLFNYISPAFQNVSSDISLHEIKQFKTNAFYKEYEKGIALAKLLLKRFGYHISNVEKKTINSPPFWIDMSKLFELYVLGLLKDQFNKKVRYQFSTYGNALDYLLIEKGLEMVIDAKYKLKYIETNGVKHEDARQISGYSRLEKVYQELGIEEDQLISCLIIHPDQENGADNLEDIKEDLIIIKDDPKIIKSASNIKTKIKTIKPYRKMYKLGVKLPTIKY